jgi:hypothetical protein
MGLDLGGLVVFRFFGVMRDGAEGLLDGFGGIGARGSGEALGLDSGFAGFVDGDFDGFHGTLMVSLVLPLRSRRV